MDHFDYHEIELKNRVDIKNPVLESEIPSGYDLLLQENVITFRIDNSTYN